MAIGSGSDTRVAYVAETNFGVTPATPAFNVMRVRQSGMRSEKGTVTSEEIRPDRNITDEMMVSRSVTGSHPFELSNASFDDMIQAALMGTWSANVVSNGTTRRSFTVEETIELGAADSFRRFRGCMVNTLSLNIQAEQVITGQIGWMGVEETISTAAVAGATYVAANTEPVMTASAHVGALTVGAITADIMSMTLEIDNGLRRRPVVSSLFTLEPGYGMCNVTGQIEAYFGSNDLYQAALNHESAAITLTVGVDANKKYTFLIPKAILGNAEIPPAGQTNDIMVRLPFRGVLSGGRSIQVTRLVA